MALQAIVFDFDGVIADSEPLHLRAFQAVLGGAGITLTEREYYDRYLGFDDVGVFRAIGEEQGARWNAEEIRTFVARKAESLEALERGVSMLFPGAAEAIRRVAAGVPLGIASGARGAEIRRVLVRENLIGCFAAIVSADDTHASKPAPEPYLRALQALSAKTGSTLPPRQCVAVEDSLWGLESARAAGLQTVAVTHTYSAAVLSPASLTISSLHDLQLGSLAQLCPD